MARAAEAAKPPAQAAAATPHAAGNNKVGKAKPKRPDDYTSEGVEDNDVFLLPVSDYQVMMGITLLAAAVRLFRIYQPTSVVFDEVQCVSRPSSAPCPRALAGNFN